MEIPEKKTEVEEVPMEETKPTSMLDSITSVFQTTAPAVSEEKVTEPIVEEKIEVEDEIPDNLLLKENEKKCPKGYYRHPSHSRNCTRKKRGVSISVPLDDKKKGRRT